MIPKLIWQTHEAEYDHLEPFQKNISNTWQNLNPGWDYKYVSKTSRDKYVEDFDPFLYSCYLELTGINQADLFKMIIVYQYGGFYADMDSVCSKPLDKVVAELSVGKEIVCSSQGFQADGNDINCSNFGAIARSKNFEEIISLINDEYNKILDEESVELKNLNPGIPTWLAFNSVNSNNQEALFFNDDYFIHSERLKSEFETDYLVYYKGRRVKYSEFLELSNLTI